MATEGYLLDTNILVALIRGNALGRYVERTYLLSQQILLCAISVVTVGEMYALGHKWGWGEKKLQRLHDLLDKIVQVSIDHEFILQAYGKLNAYCEKHGWSIGQNDLWIAATAHVTELTLLTTDRDFDFLHGDWIQRIWIDPNQK